MTKLKTIILIIAALGLLGGGFLAVKAINGDLPSEKFISDYILQHPGAFMFENISPTIRPYYIPPKFLKLTDFKKMNCVMRKAPNGEPCCDYYFKVSFEATDSFEYTVPYNFYDSELFSAHLKEDKILSMKKGETFSYEGGFVLRKRETGWQLE